MKLKPTISTNVSHYSILELKVKIWRLTLGVKISPSNTFIVITLYITIKKYITFNYDVIEWTRNILERKFRLTFI